MPTKWGGPAFLEFRYSESWLLRGLEHTPCASMVNRQLLHCPGYNWKLNLEGILDVQWLMCWPVTSLWEFDFQSHYCVCLFVCLFVWLVGWLVSLFNRLVSYPGHSSGSLSPLQRCSRRYSTTPTDKAMSSDKSGVALHWYYTRFPSDLEWIVPVRVPSMRCLNHFEDYLCMIPSWAK